MTINASRPQRANGRTRWRPWIQAARPIAFPMIFLPLLIGQAFAWHHIGEFSWGYFGYAVLFGAIYQVFLLYSNDHADEAIDRTNDNYWLSGGSRVLPLGLLRSDDLLRGARVAFVALGALTVWLVAGNDRPWMAVLVIVAILLSWMYHRRPLQLSYRGGGEYLQGLGCGIVLPLMGYYLQRGELQNFPWVALIPLYLVFHTSHIVTALPDLQSDTSGNKRTFPVRYGEPIARVTILVLLALAYTSGLLFDQTISLVVVGPACLVLVYLMASDFLVSNRANHTKGIEHFVTWVSVGQAWFLCTWATLLFMDRAT